MSEPVAIICRVKRLLHETGWNPETKQQEYVKLYEIEPLGEVEFAEGEASSDER